MGFEAGNAVDHVHAGVFQAAGPVDVAGFVETGLQLDQRRDFLAVLGRPAQCPDDRRIAAGAIQRLLDGQDLRIFGRLLDQAHDGIESFRRDGRALRRGPGPPARGRRRRSDRAAAAAANPRVSGRRTRARLTNSMKAAALRTSISYTLSSPRLSHCISQFFRRGSGLEVIESRTAARRRRANTAFSISLSRFSTSSSCNSTSASRAMRNTALASTSQPGKSAERLAAMTSSSQARCRSFSEGRVINRESCIGTGTTTIFSAGSRPGPSLTRRHCRGDHRGHVHLQAGQEGARIQLVHGQRSQYGHDFAGEIRLKKLLCSSVQSFRDQTPRPCRASFSKTSRMPSASWAYILMDAQADGVDLFGGSHAGDVATADFGRPTPHQARHADQKEFVQVGADDGQKLQPLQKRQIIGQALRPTRAG